MKNLAKVDPVAATLACEAELQAAGIPSRVVRPREGADVQAHVQGALGKFTLTRSWCYWVARGPMPLDLAQQIYLQPDAPSVRVAGHCGAPPLDEWAVCGIVDTYHIDTPEGLALWAAYARRASSGVGEWLSLDQAALIEESKGEDYSESFRTSVQIEAGEADQLGLGAGTWAPAIGWVAQKSSKRPFAYRVFCVADAEGRFVGSIMRRF